MTQKYIKHTEDLIEALKAQYIETTHNLPNAIRINRARLERSVMLLANVQVIEGDDFVMGMRIYYDRMDVMAVGRVEDADTERKFVTMNCPRMSGDVE